MLRKLIEVLCMVHHLNAGIGFGETVYTVVIMYLLVCVIFRYLKFTLMFSLLRGLIELLVGLRISVESLNNIL
jgi:hypothetical protein